MVFLALGWMRFAPGDAWNLPTDGIGVGSRLVSPAGGVSALALAHFVVFVIAPSAPPPPEHEGSNGRTPVSTEVFFVSSGRHGMPW